MDSGGERYLEIYRRLESYFERRKCRAPDELADETLNRVARRLEEEGTIDSPSPAHFCYVSARFVFHEYLRRSQAVVEVPVEETLSFPAAEVDETLLAEFEKCLDQLTAADRELIVDYYRADGRSKIEQRRALAARLGITANALTIRACRVRDRLEACVKARLRGD
jgi:DNA-directed RNA polymerase specialized sigma24 family protein